MVGHSLAAESLAESSRHTIEPVEVIEFWEVFIPALRQAPVSDDPCVMIMPAPLPSTLLSAVAWGCLSL